jgi:small subunit ribosomal protein S7
VARRRRAQKRTFSPDPKFKSLLVSEFVSNLNRCGLKRTAENIFYGAVDMVAEKSGGDGLSVFKKAIDNVKPAVEVKSRRVGGANYQVPVEVMPERRTSLAIRWMITYAKDRSEKSMADKLAAEIIQASKGEGGAVRKKIDTHKMADANKAFAHFRW